MKINIQRINYNGVKDEKGKWWTWTEICDRCGKEIYNNNDYMCMEKPNSNELDFCTECYKYLLNNKIPYKEAEKMYKNKN